MCFFSYFSVFSVTSVVNYYKILIPEINEATDMDLKVIDPVRKFFSNGVERLMQSCWKRGDTFLISVGVCLKPRTVKAMVEMLIE